MNQFPGHTGAVFSDCRTYRYALWRKWNLRGENILFVGLNPSRAHAHFNDPTITRCIDFAKRWGFGGLYFGNLYAFRTPYPEDLQHAIEQGDTFSTGPDTDKWLKAMADDSKKIVFAFGSWKFITTRARAVRGLFPNASCMGLNKDGWPKHPLYLNRATQLIEYGNSN